MPRTGSKDRGLSLTLRSSCNYRSKQGPARSKELQVVTESELPTSTAERSDLPRALRAFGTRNDASGPAQSAPGLPSPAEARYLQISFTDGTHEPFKRHNETDELYKFEFFPYFSRTRRWPHLQCVLVAVLFVVAGGSTHSPLEGSEWDLLANGSLILTRTNNNASRELGNEYGRITLKPEVKLGEQNTTYNNSGHGWYSRFHASDDQIVA
ncbi:hypothetical protein HPB51_013774 [Rhipicephalus microplus]|uniref:Uncharacterized protein n=1 Tax=Rhipicephalus microplus TaxID=6941 RepID=A0A9J6F2W1_RHIMP|nr:hypothetical protein HPB51_013774 [Rhipicephalus microplus]